MGKQELSSLPLVVVDWRDSHGKAVGEYSLDEIAKDFHKPAIIRTFGLLAQEDAHGLSLVSEMTADPGMDFTHYRNLAHILRENISNIEYLGIPKRPKKKKAPKTESKGPIEQ